VQYHFDFLKQFRMNYMGSSNLKIIGLFIIFVAITVLTTFGLLKDFKSADSSSMTKDEVQAIVKDYIQANPEAIIKSLTEYQQKAQKNQDAEAQKNVISKKDELENDATTPVAGNPKGDVTIVEFFDYSCGYCKKVFPYLTELLKEDPNVKLVLKEFPILGPNSLLASQAALAVNIINPAKYVDFHNALMKERVSGKDAILKIAGDLGLDTAAISAKMDSPEVAAIIEKNRKLAGDIGVHGTPAFVINGEFIPGAIEYDEMKQRVKAAREKPAAGQPAAAGQPVEAPVEAGKPADAAKPVETEKPVEAEKPAEPAKK
jgi:protein-disulfide isomerase